MSLAAALLYLILVAPHFGILPYLFATASALIVYVVALFFSPKRKCPKEGLAILQQRWELPSIVILIIALLVLYGSSYLESSNQRIGHWHGVTCVAFRPGSTEIAAAGWKGLKIWDYEQGAGPRTLYGESGTRALAYSPNGSILALGGTKDRVSLFDASSLQRLSNLEQGGNVNAIAFSPDGSMIAAGGERGIIKIWETGSGTLRTSINNRKEIMSLSFSPDGSLLASADAGYFYMGGEVKLWSVDGGSLVDSLEDDYWFRTLTFLPGKNIVIAGGGVNRRIKVWNIENRSHKTFEHGKWGEWVQCVCASPDGKLIITAGGRGILWLWDASNMSKLHGIDAGGYINSVAFSSDGNYFAAGFDEFFIVIFDTMNKKIVLSPLQY
jgi:WD40 repeat protein